MSLLKSSLLSWQINRYIYAVQRCLKCSARSKRKFSAHLKDSIASFINEAPDCTMDDIIAFSGPPEMLAQDFMETLDEKEIDEAQKDLKIRKFVMIVLALFATALSAAVIYILYLTVSHNTASISAVLLASIPE